MTPTADFKLLTERELRAKYRYADQAGWPFMIGMFACWFGCLMVMEYFPESLVVLALFVAGVACVLIAMWRLMTLQPKCPACNKMLRAEVMRTRCCVRCKNEVLIPRHHDLAARKRWRRLAGHVTIEAMARWYPVALAACGLGALAFLTLGMFAIMLALIGTPVWGWVWLRTLRARFALPFFCGLVGLAISAFVFYQRWP